MVALITGDKDAEAAIALFAHGHSSTIILNCKNYHRRRHLTNLAL